MSLPLTGARHAEVMSDYRRLAQFGLMVSDSSRGRVHVAAGRPVIRYDLNGDDLREVPSRAGRLERAVRRRGRAGGPAPAAARRPSGDTHAAAI